MSGLCIICLDRNIEILLSPCGHVAYCSICADKITHCSICRTKKENAVKAYFPCEEEKEQIPKLPMDVLDIIVPIEDQINNLNKLFETKTKNLSENFNILQSIIEKTAKNLIDEINNDKILILEKIQQDKNKLDEVLSSYQGEKNKKVNEFKLVKSNYENNVDYNEQKRLIEKLKIVDFRVNIEEITKLDVDFKLNLFKNSKIIEKIIENGFDQKSENLTTTNSRSFNSNIQDQLEQ